MLTYNSLGVVEQASGRLAEARAWYERSRQLAVELNDQPGIGRAAQNIGIVCQLEGEAARAQGDEAAARRSFQAALHSVEESQSVWLALCDKLDEAASLSQLAQIHFLLGDLDAAERNAHAARDIRESLGLKEVWKDYYTLAEIAEARGDTAAAAAWAQRRDDKRAELERLAGGGSAPQRVVAPASSLSQPATAPKVARSPLRLLAIAGAAIALCAWLGYLFLRR